MRRNSLAILKQIIKAIREKPASLRSLQTKINADDKMIKKYTEILETLDVIKITKFKKLKKDVAHAELTQHGKKLKF